MKTDGFIIIALNGIEYKVYSVKLQTILSYLENKEIVIKNEKQLSELLEKYELYDEGFLKNINKI